MMAWVDPNTLEYVSSIDADADDQWCDACQEHVWFCSLEEFGGYLDAWWLAVDFPKMERITGLSAANYPADDGGQAFLDACDAWWKTLDYERQRASLNSTAAAETWEKSLTSLTVYVFNSQGNLVAQRSFTSEELADKSATFALPHSAAGTTCDFYAVANLSLTGVTTKSALLSKVEASAADYNGTFAEVSTKAKRAGGFVMSASASKSIAEGSTTDVAMALRRTVAKLSVQTTIDAAFAEKYSGTITVTGVKLSKAASQSPVIAPATPSPGAMSYTHTQTATAAAGRYDNLFYVFENGALAEGNRVQLEITASYDADGSTSTTSDRTEIVYTVPVTGKAGGAIVRNGYYRIEAAITGLVGSEVGLTITVADWESPVTQQIDLGA